MKILDNSSNIQNIKGLVAKTLDKTEKKDEPKDNTVIGTQENTEVENADKLKKFKEAIGKGVEALHAGAEKTSEYLDRSPKTDSTLNAALQFFKTIKSFPRFIYPSIIGMTKEQREFALSILDKLPLKDVGGVRSITMLKSLPNASGGAGPLPSSPFIILTKDNFDIGSSWAKDVLTHETGHVKDYNTGLFGLPKLFSESSHSPWGKPPYITDYAAHGPGWYPSEWDDFAESYAYYHNHPEELQSKCPEKFKRMEELEKNGFFEKMIDNKAFRETGKLMGSIMEKVPYLENGLAMISLVGGLIQAYKGLGELKRAEKTGDKRLKMNATLNFAAGSCFASKIFCIPGMAIEGVKSELNRSIVNKEITSEQANAVVQATIGSIAGPVGHAINWLVSKLPWNKIYKINDNTIENLTGELPAYKLDFINALKDKELTRKDLKKILKKMEFTGTDIDLVKEYADKPKGVVIDSELYKISKTTIENLQGKFPENKLDMINSMIDKEIPEKEFNRALEKMNFDRGEIALIKAFAEGIEKDTDEGENENTGSLKRAASIGIGGATGAVAGGFIGPYAGVMAGFAIAGPVGGLVGLIAGALIGFKTGSYLGGRAGNLVGKGLEKVIEGEVKGNNEVKK